MSYHDNGYIHNRIQTHFDLFSKQGILTGIVTRNQKNFIQNSIKFLQNKGYFHINPTVLEAGLYDRKDALIKNLCEKLDNIHPSSVLFVDNSDIERERVANSGVNCTIAPFPHHIGLFEYMLLSLPFVEKLKIHESDIERTVWYEEKEKDDFKFDVELICDSTDISILERLTELANKTNQFNFTTIRYSYNSLSSMVKDKKYHIFALRAVPVHQSNIKPNIFGMVVVQKDSRKEWHIENLLMSCRYMGLKLDNKVLKLIAEIASKEEIPYLVGRYFPSERNKIVRDWYKNKNFLLIKKNNGSCLYRALVNDLLKQDDAVPTNDQIENYLAKHIKLTFPTIPKTRIRTIDNSEEVYIKSGILKTGINEEDAEIINEAFGIFPEVEIGQETCNIKAFWMDKYCINNERYAIFLNSQFSSIADRKNFLRELLNRQPLCSIQIDSEGVAKSLYGVKDLPAIVPYQYAEAYAKWAGGRLPEENEWEWAARGEDGRWFPWGNTLPSVNTVWIDSEKPGTIMCCPENISPFGVVGMVGNVWQWCSTTFNGHFQYRGGDYRLDSPYWKRTTLRPLEKAEHCGNVVGFRVIRV